jgi:hypothetical protein
MTLVWSPGYAAVDPDFDKVSAITPVQYLLIAVFLEPFQL